MLLVDSVAVAAVVVADMVVVVEGGTEFDDSCSLPGLPGP